MPFTVSPGVVTREIDLSTIVPEAGATVGGAVGAFQWGPVQEIRTISSESDLTEVFHKPNLETYNYFFTAANFLSYGNNLQTVRVANSTARNATSDATNAVAITNNYSYEVTYDSDHGGTASDDYGNFVAKYPGVLGNSLKVSICGADKPGATLTGTVTVGTPSSGAATVTGVGTSFTTEVGVGDVVTCHSNSYVVTAVTNTTQIVVYGSGISAQGAGNTFVRKTNSGFSESETTMIGTLTCAAGNTAVTGTNTKFDLQITAGDILTINSQEVTVNSITSNTALVLRTALTNAVSANVFTRKWEYHGSVDTAPTTSAYGTRKGTTQDEVHIVVADEDGEWTGTKGQVMETFSNLSVASGAVEDDGTQQFYKTVINTESDYIWWMDHDSAGDRDASLNTLAWGAVANSAVAPQYQANGIITTDSLTGGVDGNTLSDADLTTGYNKFKNPDEVDVACITTANTSSVVAKHIIENIAHIRKDCMVFVSPDEDDVVNASVPVDRIIEKRDAIGSTSYAILDGSYKYQYDKYNDLFRYVPCNGDTAGLVVRTAAERDFFFSPAGFNRGNLNNIVKLAFNPTKAERDTLYKNAINPIVTFPGQGTVLFGDKTMLTKPSAFDRINVRRLFIVLEKSISRFAEASLFEFNDEFTRARFTSSVEPFLRDIQGRGGITDFAVVCDDSNNTPEVIDRNEFVGSIFIKPTKSINFILLNFVAVRSGVEFSEITNAI